MVIAQRSLELAISDYIKSKRAWENEPSRFSSFRGTTKEEAISTKFFKMRDALEKSISKYEGPHTWLYEAARNWMIDSHLSHITATMCLAGRSDEAAEIMSKLDASEQKMIETFNRFLIVPDIVGDDKEESDALIKGFRSYAELRMYADMHVSQWFIKVPGNIWDGDAIEDFHEYLDDPVQKN